MWPYCIKSVQTGRSQLSLLPSNRDLGCYYFPYRNLDPLRSFATSSDKAVHIFLNDALQISYVIVAYHINIYYMKFLKLEFKEIKTTKFKTIQFNTTKVVSIYL